MTSSTSLIISGSRAEVGLSKSMQIGSMASARAIATRCCCPPESCPGYFSPRACGQTYPVKEFESPFPAFVGGAAEHLALAMLRFP